MKQPRDYQEQAVENVVEYWAGGGGSALVVQPTGSGKSLTMAHLGSRLFREFDGTRIVVLTHVQELVEQDAEEMQEFWPEAPIGIYSAGLGKRDGQAPIVFASVQSVARDPSVIGERHVVMIDEAHLLSRKDDGNYQRVLQHLRSQCPQMRVGGFTATDYRTDTGKLTESWKDKPPLFDQVVYEIDPLTLIKRGLLSPLVPYAPNVALDVSGVRRQGGDFNQKDMQKAVDRSDVSEAAMDEVCAAGADREGWIIFAAGVEHAEHLRDMLRKRGVTAEMILGETPNAERKDIIARYKRKEIRAIVGNNVLTTGFNAPHIDLIATLRPTDSKGLHVQMLGRGLRIAPGKQDCLVLDFARNVQRHGAMDMIDGSKTPGAPGKAPVKECDACGRICHASAKECPGCGHKFPSLDDIKFHARSSATPIFSNQAEPIWYNVESINFRKHFKRDDSEAPPSLRIEYTTKLMVINHWVSLEHPQSGGFARRWWEKNSYSGEAPRTVDEAIERKEDLRVPGRIQVMKEGKYNRVLFWDYSVPAGQVIPVTAQLRSWA